MIIDIKNEAIKKIKKEYTDSQSYSDVFHDFHAERNMIRKVKLESLDWLKPINPDSEPDIEIVLYNLRGLMGYFMAEEEETALFTMCHAERLIERLELTKANNVTDLTNLL